MHVLYSDEERIDIIDKFEHFFFPTIKNHVIY
jgi:hypothetical protein